MEKRTFALMYFIATFKRSIPFFHHTHTHIFNPIVNARRVNNAEGILPLSTISLINSIEWRSACCGDISLQNPKIKWNEIGGGGGAKKQVRKKTNAKRKKRPNKHWYYKVFCIRNGMILRVIFSLFTNLASWLKSELYSMLVFICIPVNTLPLAFRWSNRILLVIKKKKIYHVNQWRSGV